MKFQDLVDYLKKEEHRINNIIQNIQQQLKLLKLVANKLGLYDAADVVQGIIEKGEEYESHR